jgi:hypothetical protein
VLRALSFMGMKSYGFMTRESSLPKTKLIPRGLVEQMYVHGWTWRTAGAVFGLCGGIIAPLVGSILTAIAWFTGPEWHGLSVHRYGTVLLFLTIPFLICGAHCLDLIDRHAEKARKSRYN